MMKLIFVVSTLIVVAFAEEEALSRSRRFAPFPFGIFGGGFPFGGGGAYAGQGGAYAGAGAGAGVGPYWGAPSYNYEPPRSYFPFGWFPFPYFPFPQNWYEGENVCKETKTQDANAPDEFSQWLKDVDSPNFNSDYSHEQESCRGSNNKFVCIRRIFDGSGSVTLKATKYECCHGFVRNPNGPGCVESGAQPPNAGAPAPPNAGAPPSPGDKVWYNISPNDKYSKSSKSVEKSVGKVPIQ